MAAAGHLQPATHHFSAQAIGSDVASAISSGRWQPACLILLLQPAPRCASHPLSLLLRLPIRR